MAPCTLQVFTCIQDGPKNRILTDWLTSVALSIYKDRIMIQWYPMIKSHLMPPFFFCISTLRMTSATRAFDSFLHLEAGPMETPRIFGPAPQSCSGLGLLKLPSKSAYHKVFHEWNAEYTQIILDHFGKRDKTTTTLKNFTTYSTTIPKTSDFYNAQLHYDCSPSL